MQNCLSVLSYWCCCDLSLSPFAFSFLAFSFLARPFSLSRLLCAVRLPLRAANQPPQVDELKAWTVRELAAAARDARDYADASSRKVEAKLMELMARQQADTAAKGNAFAESAAALDHRLSALDQVQRTLEKGAGV